MKQDARIEAIVFDMDGVLIDTESISERAWVVSAEKIGIDAPISLFAYCTGMTLEEIEAILMEKLEGKKARSFIAEWESRFDQIASTEGVPAMPFAAETLSALKGKYRLALASSTHEERVREQLSSLGLLGFFEAVATGDMVQNGKPAPDIYLLACEKLMLPPECCAAVEDSPNGVQSASAAGLCPIMIPDRIEPNERTLSLLWRRYSSLEELCKAALNGFE